MNINATKTLRTTAGTALLAFAMMTVASCDMRSGIAREEEEKFKGTPTPTASPTPTAEPIDPADIVRVDTSQTGDELVVNGPQKVKKVACVKYNAVNINGDSYEVTIKGVCQEITINGDNNKISVDAAARFVVNGIGNEVKYSKFANGQRPSVSDHGDDNIIEKVAANAPVNSSSTSKGVK
jgi:DUF3060 family protein